MAESAKCEGGFVAGILVHTPEGPVPIERIRAGDWVLSRPGSGKGEISRKRVVNTYELESREVWYAAYQVIEDSQTLSIEGCVVVAGSHPFWVKGFEDFTGEGYGIKHNMLKWVGAECFPDYRTSGSFPILELLDGRLAMVLSAGPILRMANPEQGLIKDSHEAFEECCEGYLVDFGEGIPRSVFGPDHKPLCVCIDVEPDENAGYPLLTRKVYNLEVEDYHTYFVDSLGVWVHNSSGRGMS
jgi:hypothetical protein